MWPNHPTARQVDLFGCFLVTRGPELCDSCASQLPRGCLGPVLRLAAIAAEILKAGIIRRKAFYILSCYSSSSLAMSIAVLDMTGMALIAACPIDSPVVAAHLPSRSHARVRPTQRLFIQ